MADFDELVSVAQAAAAMGVSPRRVRDLIRAKRLRAHRIAGRWLLHRDTVFAARASVRRRGRPATPWTAWSEIAAGCVTTANESRYLPRAQIARTNADGPEWIECARSCGGLLSGVDAAAEFLARFEDQRVAIPAAGADLDLYLPAGLPRSELPRMHADHSHDGSAAVRFVPAEAWTIARAAGVRSERHEGVTLAPPQAVGLDLLSHDDPRAGVAGSLLIDLTAQAS